MRKFTFSSIVLFIAAFIAPEALSAPAFNNSPSYGYAISSQQKKLIIKQDDKGYYGYAYEGSSSYYLKPKYKYASDFENGYAIVAVEKSHSLLFGLIDDMGKYTIKPSYETLYREGNAIVSKDISGKQGLIDSRGNVILECKFEKVFWDEVNKVWCCVAPSSQLSLLADDFKKIFESGTAWLYSKTEKNCIALENAQGDGKIVLLSKSGILEMPYIFDSFLDETHIKVKQNNQCGLINTSGTVIIPCQYSSIEPQVLQVHSFYFAKNEDGYTVYDVNGPIKDLSKPYKYINPGVGYDIILQDADGYNYFYDLYHQTFIYLHDYRGWNKTYDRWKGKMPNVKDYDGDKVYLIYNEDGEVDGIYKRKNVNNRSIEDYFYECVKDHFDDDMLIHFSNSSQNSAIRILINNPEIKSSIVTLYSKTQPEAFRKDKAFEVSSRGNIYTVQADYYNGKNFYFFNSDILATNGSNRLVMYNSKIYGKTDFLGDYKYIDAEPTYALKMPYGNLLLSYCYTVDQYSVNYGYYTTFNQAHPVSYMSTDQYYVGNITMINSAGESKQTCEFNFKPCFYISEDMVICHADKIKRNNDYIMGYYANNISSPIRFMDLNLQNEHDIKLADGVFIYDTVVVKDYIILCGSDTQHGYVGYDNPICLIYDKKSFQLLKAINLSQKGDYFIKIAGEFAGMPIIKDNNGRIYYLELFGLELL